MLSQRAEEANLQYLTENKRRRKNVPKKVSTIINSSNNYTSSSNNIDVPSIKKITTKNRKRNKKLVLSSSEDEMSSSEEDEEVEEEDEEKKEENSDNDSVHDISDYSYLVDTLHYDEEYDCVYKSTRVVELGGYIVVYRRRQLKSGLWAKGECISPIFAKDVVEMTELHLSKMSNNNSNRNTKI